MNHIKNFNNKIELVKSNIEKGLKLIQELDNVIERWKQIDGYDYMISSFGRVKNVKTNRILKLIRDKGEYNTVGLYNNGKKRAHKIHRLIATAFVKNPEHKPLIDHIDNNPFNNHISNLRFCTYQENQRNRSIFKNNKSGTTGVSYNKKYNKWYASIKIDDVSIHLGCYDNKQDAINARVQRANQVFGNFTHSSQKL